MSNADYYRIPYRLSAHDVAAEHANAVTKCYNELSDGATILDIPELKRLQKRANGLIAEETRRMENGFNQKRKELEVKPCEDCAGCGYLEITRGFPQDSLTCNALKPKSVNAFARCPHPDLIIRKRPELKPCPFCGGKAEWDNRNFYVNHTKDCYSNPLGHDYEQHESSEAELWNRRVG